MPFAAPKVTCDERPDAKRAAGIVFVAKDGDVLLLRRSADEKNFGGHWGLPGGGGEEGETAQDTAMREFKEECGLDIDMGTTLKLLDRVDTPTGMQFSTFAKPTDDKFVPTLDAEHSGYCWASLDQLPRPLHPQVERLLSSHIGAVADMTPEDWAGLREGFTKWTREEEAEPEHADDGRPARAQDQRMAMDRQIYDELGRPGNDLLAFDAKPSVRTYDKDGRLRVIKAHISKANVCPYWGHEIPDYESLGLQPDRKYQLLRHPSELAKAAKTSNGIPLLLGHTPVTPDRHRHDVVVGSIGTDFEFNDPYLDNSLVVWTREGIDAVESEEAKELSSAYRYKAVMTPGVFKGIPYDGVMTEIEFNHVALVPEGRAGADVVVGDSQFTGQTKEILMSKVLSRFGGASAVALSFHLLPKLAADAKLDLSPIFEGVSKKNFASKKTKIAQDAKAAAKKAGLAQDANLDDVTEFLDKLEKVDVVEGADSDPSSGLPLNETEMKKKAQDEAEEAEKKKAEDRAAKDAEMKDFLKSKLSAEDMKACDAFFDKEAKDETVAEKEGEPGAGEPKGAKDTVSKGAMDAALKAHGDNIRKSMRETAQAYADVEPYVGKLQLGMDSAAEVYRTALIGLGMDEAEVKGLHDSALKPVLQAQTKPGEKNRQTYAQDGAHEGGDNFSKRWGGSVDRIGAA